MKKLGILWKTKCYLAGNLQDISDKEANAWRSYFKDSVRDMGIICLSPLDKVFTNFDTEKKDFRQRMFNLLGTGDLKTVHQEMQAIRRKDMAQIDFSNCFVGVLNTNAESYGIIEELSLAERSQKPIYLVIKPSLKRVPLWIAGMLEPRCLYSSLDSVIRDLKLINSGRKKVSSNNWRIFEKDYM